MKITEDHIHFYLSHGKSLRVLITGQIRKQYHNVSIHTLINEQTTETRSYPKICRDRELNNAMTLIRRQLERNDRHAYTVRTILSSMAVNAENSQRRVIARRLLSNYLKSQYRAGKPI